MDFIWIDLMPRTTYTVKTPVRFYESSEYATRLLFVNNQLNPRDELGKFGITFHHPLTAWPSKTIKVNLQVLKEDDTTQNQITYINRNSLRKYLKARVKHFEVDTATDQVLIDQLNSTTWEDSNKQDVSFSQSQGQLGENGLRHAGNHNKRKFNNIYNAIVDSFVGAFASWLYLKTVSGVNWLKARFLFINREKDFFHVSEVLAARRFREASKTVPAYKEHLERSKFKADSDTDLEAIPVTTKSNYIKANAQKHWKTLVNGRLPQQFKVDTSTGTTENPTVWVRSNDEVQTVKDSMQTSWKFIMGSRKPFIINAFALGPWATGLSVHEISREMGSTYSVGAEPDKIFEVMELQYKYEQDRLQDEVSLLKKEFTAAILNRPELDNELTQLANIILHHLQKDHSLSVAQAVAQQINQQSNAYLRPYQNHFSQMIKALNAEKQQLIISGYPPFLLSLPDYAKKKGIDFSKYNVIAGSGGQAIGEPMRRAMEDKGYMSVASSYGASDLDINLGFETNTEVEIRRVLESNPGMARELFGANKGIPMIFRFDPLNYHIECSEKDNHLIYTCNRENRSSPRIRYDLQDTGRVYAASDVHAMLAKYGIFGPQKASKHNLPFLFIWGRDSTAGFGTCNVPFDELESAVHTVDSEKNTILKRSFYSYVDNHVSRFDIWLELNDNVALFEDDDRRSFHANLIKSMADKNEYFAEEINRLGDDDNIPNIQFFTRGHSPIAEPGGTRKQVLVFQKGINFDGNFGHSEDTRQLSQITKKEYLAIINELTTSNVSMGYSLI